MSDQNRERVDRTRHENAHVLPSWLDSGNDTNPPENYWTIMRVFDIGYMYSLPAANDTLKT